MSNNVDLVLNNRKSSGLTSFSVVFSYIYCMMASNVLISVPIPGGSLFILSRLATLFTRFGGKKSWKLLSTTLRMLITALLAVVFLAALVLAVIYPARQAVPISQMLLLAGIVFISTLRETFSRRLLRACPAANRTKPRTAIRIFELDFILFMPLALLLFFTQSAVTSLYILGGYVLSAILEYVTMINENEIKPLADEEEVVEIDRLHHVYAYRIFQNLTLFAAIALQITYMLAFAMIGYSVSDLMFRLFIAAICIYTTRKAIDNLFRAERRKDIDPGIIMVSGISMWLVGLMLLARNIVVLNVVESYVSLLLCTCGVTASVTALARFESDMRSIAAFSLGHPPTSTYDNKRKMLLEFANLAGQALALLGLALVFFYSAGSFPVSLDDLQKSLRPVLLLPALLLVMFTLLAALKFPMTNGYMIKLRRFLKLKDHGETNLPLQQQLEDVIIKINRRHYGMKLLLSMVRPLYYHRICGKENVVIEDGSSAVFICNHGELYGPIVANLYIPYSFRPWSISELTNPQELTDYIYQFTFIRQRWIIPCMKRPLARIFMPVILWAIHSIESIAVYRDKPRELIRTFKITTAAMEAGDNILIFPENPRSETQDKPGYLKDGIGEFYSGFTMLGPMYYEKTGKRLQFIPIYADKKRRTLTFGKPTSFDPDAFPVPEKERIVKHLRDEMISMSRAGQSFT